MTKLELLSAGLVVAAMLATPAMRQHHVTSRHLAADTYGSATPAARYIDGRLCYPAPRVGAFATQPWDNGNVPCEPGPGY